MKLYNSVLQFFFIDEKEIKIHTFQGYGDD